MADVDVLIHPPARRFYEEELTRPEQRQVDDIITLITLTPELDGELIFPFAMPDGEPGRIYYDGWFWVIFRMLNAWTVSIYNIGFEIDIPRTE